MCRYIFLHFTVFVETLCVPGPVGSLGKIKRCVIWYTITELDGI